MRNIKDDKKKTILIVDDEKVVCSTFSTLLKFGGYICLTASDGIEALKVNIFNE